MKKKTFLLFYTSKIHAIYTTNHRLVIIDVEYKHKSRYDIQFKCI